MVHLTIHRKKDGKQNGASASPQFAARPSASSHGSTTTLNDQKSLALRINVIKARNLAAKDKSGTSDPYLVVNLGTSRQSTPTISKTLNPEWKTSFEMPLGEVPLIECICWDKDRWSKDYMGEFDIAVEDIFVNGQLKQEPRWYKLKSKRKGNKSSIVSGEVQMQFSLVDTSNPTAADEDTLRKYKSFIAADDEEDDTISRTTTIDNDDEVANDGDDAEDETSDETDEPTKGTTKASKKEKKKRKARLRRKSIAVRAYEFVGGAGDVSGIVFMEIAKITDLPPERNLTRTSFDMDPFVVASLGRKVLRTRVIRHNLNPIYNEKMVFQVMRHEQAYTMSFSVVDRDKLSGNDFVASTNFPVQKMIAAAPEEDPETGLYRLYDPPEYSPPQKENKSRFRLPLSRTSSSSSVSKLARPVSTPKDSHASFLNTSLNVSQTELRSDGQTSPQAPTSAPYDGSPLRYTTSGHDQEQSEGDPDMVAHAIPLELKNKDRWEAKHSPVLYIRAKYLPYRALRQQFWRVMLKQYDADDSRRVSKIELTTMLDTLGSTLRESTIDTFFERFAEENESSDTADLTFDQAVICLEEQLQKTAQKKTLADKIKGLTIYSESENGSVANGEGGWKAAPHPERASGFGDSTNENPHRAAIPAVKVAVMGSSGEEGKHLDSGDLGDEDGEEHVIEIRECPICHQPLKHRTDADVITHIATCASSDWRQVNNLVMGGFVTASQAQRKWYSKVITKIGYGGYKLGANSANILVQDRLTGQINEERMSVYVRLGIRLLYKAMGSREMEKKRIRKMLRTLSVKQGKKYDDPASASSIEGFINFHRLDMSEVLLPIEAFKSFNEFFYRALKPSARPCSAPDNPKIIVSPADSRSVVFNTMEDATRIWVKGREYSLERLLGDAYPLDAKRYRGGAMGIFRLAPQDYHRFHVPVDGVMGTPKTIDGEYYTVNPMAIRSALDVYGDNVRVIVPIDSEAHGRVMYICIGAMMVGSTVITRKPGERIKRAEELGYFKFGGSTILCIFEPGKMVFDDDLIANSNGALETLVRVGMSIGHDPASGPYTPDMRKDEESITMEDRQEAKRKIEGSLAPDGP